MLYYICKRNRLYTYRQKEGIMKKCTFKKGEYVVYGSNGICLVEDVCDFSFSADIPKKPYFILKPKNDPNSLIYIPCDNEELVGRLRSIFSKEQIEALLHKHACEPADWQEDRKQRVLTFRSVLAKSDPMELLAMIRCIYLKGLEFAENNKKLSASDKDILQNAERFIQNEFSFSLGITTEEVAPYIRRILSLETAE